MDDEVINKVVNNEYGYVVVTERILGWNNDELYHDYAENADGHYVGSIKNAVHLYETLRIKPELAQPTDNVCSIGLSKDGKWYGWSHRAIYGFKIGSTVSKGDSGYEAANEGDFIQAALEWEDISIDEDVNTWKKDFKVVNLTDEGFAIEYTYTDHVPNENIRRKTMSTIYHTFPKVYGKGEWTAKSMCDAKEMAKAFAESVG